MKKIFLPNDKITLVDDSDYDFLNQWKWYITSNGYVARKDKEGRHFRMHRVLMNTPIGMDTDHINRNKLDNRRNNLRICTRSENNINSKTRKDNGSNFTGVCWDNSKNKWRSFINVDKNRIELGYFHLKKEAITIRKNAELRLYKDFIYA
jgi:hypothetical protein